MHYSVHNELLFACDVLCYNISTVSSHAGDDGGEKPIAHVARSLTPAGKRYSKKNKLALAFIFVVMKFLKYLFGRHFQILFDHKPLQHPLRKHHAVPLTASSRRWALTLSAYNYSINHRPGKDHANANVLICLPLLLFPQEVPEPGKTFCYLNIWRWILSHQGSLEEGQTMTLSWSRIGISCCNSFRVSCCNSFPSNFTVGREGVPAIHVCTSASRVDD